MVRDLGDVPETIAHGSEQHLKKILEPEQLLLDPKPHRALPSLARILEPENDPFVLQEHRDPGVEEALRRRPARGPGQRLPEKPVRRLDAEPPSVAVGDLVEAHVAEHGVDQVLTAVLAPLPPHLVANHDVDSHLEGRIPATWPLQGVCRRVGAVPVLPALPLAGAEAKGNHRRQALCLQPGENGVVVEPPVEEDSADLTADHLEVVEGSANGRQRAAVPRVEPERGDEAEAVAEDRQGGEPMSAVGAALLLGLHDLSPSRVEGLTVVWSIGEVDGDIDRFLRNERSNLTTEGERQGALGLPETEMAEEPAGRTVGVPPSTLGTSAVDRTAKDSGSEEQIGGIVESRGAEGSAEGAPQERKKPAEGGRSNLAVAEGPRSPTGPVGRRVFLSGPSSLDCGLATAAAAVLVHTDSSAVSLSSTSDSNGKKGGQEPPRGRQLTSDGRLPGTGIRKS